MSSESLPPSPPLQPYKAWIVQVKSKRGTTAFHFAEDEAAAIKMSRYWDTVPGFSASFWNI